MMKAIKVSALLLTLTLVLPSFSDAGQFFKLKEYDDPECTENDKSVQTAIYPTDMCTFIGTLRVKLTSSNDTLQAYMSPTDHSGGYGCDVGAPIYDEGVTGSCTDLGQGVFVKVLERFDSGTYQLTQDEDIINAFTSCSNPDQGFNYFGLYKSNFCYSYNLEGGASEYFEVEEGENVTKIIKRDYTQADCMGEDRATEYIVGECNLGHFVYSDRKMPQTTFGSVAPNYANPFSDQT
jgi:hypothetical protein